MITAIALHELGDKVRTLLFRQPAFAFHQQSIASIRKTTVPAGIGTRIVELVVDIPTEYAVAEPSLFVHEPSKLLQTHIFAADHPIDICQAELNLPDS